MSRREDRRLDFKFQGLTNDELRRRREETTIELRKTKRDDSLSKRRNVVEPANSPAFEPESYTPPSKSVGLELVAPLQSNDSNAVYEACHAFRKILSKEKNPPIQDVIELQVVGRFVDLLSGAGVPADAPAELAEKIVFESAWVLTNIASGASSQTMAVVDHGAVPVFIKLLSSSNRDIREQSVWALGNIAGDSSHLRDYLLQCEVMNGLIQVIVEEFPKPAAHFPLLRNAIWAISNLCRGKPSPAWNQVAPCIPVLREFLMCNDAEMMVDACWAFSYITDGADQHLFEVIQSGVVKHLIALLRHNGNVSVQTPALRAIGNVVTGDDNVTQQVVELGVLEPLKELLNSFKQAIKKEACWAISNITAGTVFQVRAVHEHNIFPILIKILKTAEFKTKREACWALCNATSCHDVAPDIVRFLVSEDIIPPLCEMLKCNDPKILQVAMDGIENILQVGEQDSAQSEDGLNQYALQVEDADGMDHLWSLQEHADTNVYLKAKHIIDKFFGDLDDDINVDIQGEAQKISF